MSSSMRRCQAAAFCPFLWACYVSIRAPNMDAEPFVNGGTERCGFWWSVLLVPSVAHVRLRLSSAALSQVSPSANCEPSTRRATRQAAGPQLLATALEQSTGHSVGMSSSTRGDRLRCPMVSPPNQRGPGVGRTKGRRAVTIAAASCAKVNRRLLRIKRVSRRDRGSES